MIRDICVFGLGMFAGMFVSLVIVLIARRPRRAQPRETCANCKHSKVDHSDSGGCYISHCACAFFK